MGSINMSIPIRGLVRSGKGDAHRGNFGRTLHSGFGSDYRQFSNYRPMFFSITRLTATKTQLKCAP